MMRRIGALVTAVSCATLLSSCAFLSRASESSSGEQANDYSFPSGLSSDGRWLVFNSFASNLVPGDTNAATDTFVRDNWTKAVTRVSVSSTGAQGDAGVRPASNVGRRSHRGVHERREQSRSWRHERAPRRVLARSGHRPRRRVRRAGCHRHRARQPRGPMEGSRNGFSFDVALNGNGSVLAFDTEASDLLAAPDGDTNGENDVYAATFDLSTSQRTSTRIVSRTPGSLVENNGFSRHASVDWSGNLIAFETTASNLLPVDTNNTWDVVVNDGTQLLRGTGAVRSERRDLASDAQRRRLARRVHLDRDEPRTRRHDRQRPGLRHGICVHWDRRNPRAPRSVMPTCSTRFR